MDAFDEIIAKIPTDVGGATADNGFTFQKNWALLKLLELEDSGQSYVIIFDYHDDIMILDSEKNASKIDFFQVKTSINYWKTSDLCKVEKDANGKLKKSFLGKLINHFLEFGNTRDVFFVTNNYVAKSLFESKVDSHGDILSFVQFSEKQKKEIKSKLQNELNTEISDVWLKHLYVVQNQLNLRNSTDMLVGRISSFLQKHIGASEVNPKAFYEVLFAEVTRRNDYKDFCKSKKEILENKAVSKSQFADYIQGIRNFKSFETRCQNVLSELKEGPTFSERRKIKDELNNKIKNEYFQYDNVEFRKLTNLIMSIFPL